MHRTPPGPTSSITYIPPVNSTPSPRRIDGRGLALGLCITLATGATYLLFSGGDRSPLILLCIAPLVTALISGMRETLTVGVVTVVVAAVLGTTGSGLDAVDLVLRLAAMVVVVAATIWIAASRRSRERELRALADHRRTWSALQTRLVTRPNPPEGVAVDVRYLPCDQHLDIGGDFVDAVTLPDGALGFVLGDVTGHGPEAAAFGVVLRSGWKGIAMQAPAEPDRWLAAMQHTYFEDGRYDGFATALVGRYCVDTSKLALSSAGHCWPVLDRDGPALVDTHNGMPLGISRDARWQTTEMRLDRGDAMLLYTDGLVENRMNRVDRERFGEERLVEWIGAHGIDLDQLLADFEGPGYSDDVALVRLAPV